MLLARLRWSAFGLRGRIVGAVLATTAISLGVAALVLLPRLETSLKDASKKTLYGAIKASSGYLGSLGTGYQLIPDYATAPQHSPLWKAAGAAVKDLLKWETHLENSLGAQHVVLCGPVDEKGNCHPVVPSDNQADPTALADIAAAGPFDDVQRAYATGGTHISFSPNGSTVRAAVWLPRARAVFLARSSLSEISDAVAAVRNAFEIAAGVAILLTLLLAIPLAGRLVSRLQRLRQAALQLAIGGNVAGFPADRARDEVGDLARSFSIMQRRLRQQEEARRAFVATASHELRTPLASLEGMLELLADDLRGEQPDLNDAAALLDRARVQSRRLARLAADLLDLSRIDAEVSLRSEPIELGELGRAVMAEFDLPSSDRGVAISLVDDGKPTWALADPGSVARILRILLDNALRVAPEGSQIRVFVRYSPEPMLVVSDEGPGVAQEERALIFERFKRGRETGGEAGFGLGLAIGRELAQRMGGSLVLTDSDGPGATFTLRLQPTEGPLLGSAGQYRRALSPEP
ncbi:MAG: ATP-binding protein [Solirubrobacteraceae bacterium]